MALDPRPEVFTAISHSVRRRILDLLSEQDRPVNAIASHFNVSRPAISQHLRVLLDVGLVSERRQGRERRYRLVPEDLAEIYHWLGHYQRFWKDRLGRLAEELAAQDAADTSIEPASPSTDPDALVVEQSPKEPTDAATQQPIISDPKEPTS